ncbi:MAG: hypothetical protein RRC07_11965 [Anaerolineae bacterium]|nr:hypothetical protein [Anaerolineae bacterium]
MWLLVFAGVFGLATQFFPGLESMALLAGIPLLGSLVATSQIFDEREERLLNQAFSTAFQWVSFALFVFFALYESLSWLNAGDNLIQFVQLHWIGLVFSVMILFLGVAGLPLFGAADVD